MTKLQKKSIVSLLGFTLLLILLSITFVRPTRVVRAVVYCGIPGTQGASGCGPEQKCCDAVAGKACIGKSCRVKYQGAYCTNQGTKCAISELGCRSDKDCAPAVTIAPPGGGGGGGGGGGSGGGSTSETCDSPNYCTNKYVLWGSGVCPGDRQLGNLGCGFGKVCCAPANQPAPTSPPANSGRSCSLDCSPSIGTPPFTTNCQVFHFKGNVRDRSKPPCTYELIKDGQVIDSAKERTYQKACQTHSFTLTSPAAYKVKYSDRKVSCSTDVTATCPSPANFSATNFTANYCGTGNPVFEWENKGDADFYELQVDKGDANFGSIDYSQTSITCTANPCTFNSLTLGPGTYYWRVRAVSSCGANSDWAVY